MRRRFAGRLSGRRLMPRARWQMRLFVVVTALTAAYSAVAYLDIAKLVGVGHYDVEVELADGGGLYPGSLVTLSGDAEGPGKDITPVPGVPACKGSQAVTLDGSTVWSMVPDEHRYQQIHVYASAADGGVTDLGLGVNNTLVHCGESIFWARNATGSTPAALMRWDGSALTTAYESQGFLGQPLCAGDRINIAESGTNRDRQLTASVG